MPKKTNDKIKIFQNKKTMIGSWVYSKTGIPAHNKIHYKKLEELKNKRAHLQAWMGDCEDEVL